MKEPIPFVSICLLTYHRAHELPETIDSILSQTHSNFELIINDDRSPDETESICQNFERKDSRVKYFKNHKNLRYAENQNAALRRASSEYVAILHDGDIYKPDLIEKWLNALNDDPEVGLVFNAYRAIRDDGTEVIYRENLSRITKGSSFLDYMLTRIDSPIYGIVMIRKSAFTCVGKFDQRFPTLADIDMWMRILHRYNVAYVNEPLIEIHPREKEHHNNPANINVRTQLEHIYLR